LFPSIPIFKFPVADPKVVVFVTVVTILFALAFVQLSVSGFQFAGITCLACGVATLLVGKEEIDSSK
jgi:membrane-bound ClpP family serine protease